MLLNVLCSPSRAEIIFSILARLSGPDVLIRDLPALTPALMFPAGVLSVLLVVLSSPDVLELRGQCFTFSFRIRVEDFGGIAGA